MIAPESPTEFPQYGFGFWYTYTKSGWADTEFYQDIWWFQAYADEDKFEVTDELELWISSAADSTNVYSSVVLNEATTLLTASAVALAATFF